MRQTQPSNLIRQFVIRADVDQRLNEIAQQYRIAPQSMIEKMILEWDQKPEVIEVEPLPPIQHPMSDRMWQILDYGRKFNEQRQEQEKVKL